MIWLTISEKMNSYDEQHVIYVIAISAYITKPGSRLMIKKITEVGLRRKILPALRHTLS